MPQHVLLVDDDAHIGTLVETLLREEGYEVSITTSNDGALELLRAEPIDVVLLDVIGEREDLVPLVARMRELRPEVLIVLFTAIRPSEAQAYRELLGTALVQKPFDIDELLEAIRGGSAAR